MEFELNGVRQIGEKVKIRNSYFVIVESTPE